MPTMGEKRVRLDFNPSESGLVEDLKRATAHLIDICEEIQAPDRRLVALAQTAYEQACMWAVKAATSEP